MRNLLPRTLDGIIVSSVMLFVLIWQMKSALLMVDISVDSTVHLWVMLSAILLYVAFAFVAIGTMEFSQTEQQPSEITQ